MALGLTLDNCVQITVQYHALPTVRFSVCLCVCICLYTMVHKRATYIFWTAACSIGRF